MHSNNILQNILFTTEALIKNIWIHFLRYWQLFLLFIQGVILL